MNEVKMKPFKCANGQTYPFPEHHCVFCAHCADLFFDYTHGPYLFMCSLGCEGFQNCSNFKEEPGNNGNS